MLTDFNDFWHTASWRNLMLVDCKIAHITWENVTQFLAKKLSSSYVRNTLFSSKKVGGSEKEPVVLCGKINGSNATESVQSDHPVHGHTPPVVLFLAVLTELRWKPKQLDALINSPAEKWLFDIPQVE